VHTSPSHDGFSLQSSYFYIGHFARFARPGAHRVLCAASRQDLEATAFRNLDGSVAIVVLNRTEQPRRFALRVDDAACVADLPPRSIATYLA
jgi:glucosylceramidase